MAKWIIGIIVIVVAGLGLWYSGWLGNMSSTPTTTTDTATTTTQTQAAATPPAPTNGMSANNDASDAAIQQDAAAVDTQMQGFNQDSANVDSSMSDKAVTQSY